MVFGLVKLSKQIEQVTYFSRFLKSDSMADVGYEMTTKWNKPLVRRGILYITYLVNLCTAASPNPRKLAFYLGGGRVRLHVGTK